jgi:hypothetical protein
LLPLANPETQIVRVVRLPWLTVNPSGLLQLLNIALPFGAFAVGFAVIRRESPEFDDSFCPFVSPVWVTVEPPPVVQLLEPTKP